MQSNRFNRFSSCSSFFWRELPSPAVFLSPRHHCTVYTRNWQIFVLSLALLLLGFDIGVGCLAPPQPLYSTRDGPGQLSMLSRNEHKLLVRCHPCENISLAASNQSPLNSSAENLCLHTALLSRDLSRKASPREVESRRDEATTDRTLSSILRNGRRQLL